MPITNDDIKAEIERAGLLTTGKFRNAPLTVMIGSILLNSARYVAEQGRLDNPEEAEKASIARFRKLFGSAAIMPDPMGPYVDVRLVEWDVHYDTIQVEYLVRGKVAVAGNEEERPIFSRVPVRPALIISIMEEHGHPTFAEPYKVPVEKKPSKQHTEILRRKKLRNLPAEYRMRSMMAYMSSAFMDGPMYYDYEFEGLGDQPNFEELIAHGKVKLVPAEDGKFTLEIDGLREKYAERDRLEKEAEDAVKEYNARSQFEHWHVGQSKALENWLQEMSPPVKVEA